MGNRTLQRLAFCLQSGMISNLLNCRFGRLVVMAQAESAPNYERQWLCQCDCGATVIVRAHKLKSKRKQSCGCLSRDTASAHAKRSFTKHGGRNTREYSTWTSMVRRCEDSNLGSWKHYGGRGITVCERWREDFAAFYTDMGQRPRGTSIDRIDVNGHYEPGNCRWADATTQNRNKRRTSVKSRTLGYAEMCSDQDVNLGSGSKG